MPSTNEMSSPSASIPGDDRPGPAATAGPEEVATIGRLPGLPPAAVGTIRPGLISAARTPEERVAIFEAMYEDLERIGTPEERAETADQLMKALAETRKAEGRVF